MDDLLQQGIVAFKAGKRDEARSIFITVVKQHRSSQSRGELFMIPTPLRQDLRQSHLTLAGRRRFTTYSRYLQAACGPRE